MNLPLSFEFFPPKTPEGAEKLRVARQALYAHKPEFCSVTFGAGGSTQDGTFGTVKEILDEGVAAACHFSCVGATKATVREQLATLAGHGRQAPGRAARRLAQRLRRGRRVPLRQRPGGLSSAKKPATPFTSKWRPTPRFTRRPNRPMPTCRPLSKK
jgi:hypothetical protein